MRVEMWGAMRPVNGVWQMIDVNDHQPQGVAGLYVDSAKRLVIEHETPLSKVHFATISVDETWCGRYAAGASMGLSVTVVILRLCGQPNTLVPADGALIGNGNLWFHAQGEVL